MQKSDLAIFGMGGCGNKILDTLMDEDPRFMGYFINSSITDLQSLNHYDDFDKNYLCISQQNGTGRDRNLGKRYASKQGYNILDKIQRFPQKATWFIASLGGGSGSSIISVTLRAIENLKNTGDFDKIVNLILVLPKHDSPDIILKNTVDTWEELMSYTCINNIIFIDNNTLINGQNVNEDIINKIFAEKFSMIFDLPNSKSTNFDTGNLEKLLNSKGCTYFYELPSDLDNTKEALIESEKLSILAKRYSNESNISLRKGKDLVYCGILATSFCDEYYLHEDLMNEVFDPLSDDFKGINDETNMVILSGMNPPVNTIQMIKKELELRLRNKIDVNNDFSKFKIGTVAGTESIQQTKPSQIAEQKNSKNLDGTKTIKKQMKKNLFDAM